MLIQETLKGSVPSALYAGTVAFFLLLLPPLKASLFLLCHLFLGFDCFGAVVLPSFVEPPFTRTDSSDEDWARTTFELVAAAAAWS
jgi:hypothetical protein